MQHVFISYCSEDEDFTESLSDKIRQAGFVAWKDVELRAGDDWRNKIDQAISDSFVLIAVMTPRSKNSEYVNYEWAFALGAGVAVVPILIGLREIDLHPRLSPLQHLDFTDLNHGRWELLLHTIGELAERRRPFTIRVPWDAPPVIRNAAQALDSLNTGERREAIDSLGQMNHPAAHEALVEAIRHPVQEVRILASKHLANLQDARALPGLVEGIRERNQEITASMLSRLGRPAVVDLIECLSSTDDNLREATVWTLGEIGDSRAVPRLLELLQDKDSRGRKEVVEALSKINDIAAMPGLGQALSGGDGDGRQVVIKALSKIGRATAVPFLLGCLQDKDEEVRQTALLELGEIGDATAVSALIDVLLDDESTSVRECAATALGKIGDSRAISALIDTAREGIFNLKDAAFEAVRSIGGIVAVEGLVEVLRNKKESDENRRSAALVLGSLKDTMAAPIVLECLADERGDPKMQLGAIEALGMLKDPIAVPRLSDFLRREPSDVAEAAAGALTSIGTPEALLAVKTWPKVKNRGA